MELEVRVVGGIESCFISLPLSLLQTLEATRGGGILPPVLALELRSRSGGCWNLAWSGSASKSLAIEVDQLFAECIALPDHTTVQIKAIANLPEAELVHIEPSSEDDWEILESNSELAEKVILQQVGVVYERMKFPVWLHGHMMVEFVVVSISPKKSVGTEVSVAPKNRKKGVATYQDVQKQTSVNGPQAMKALLRVQADNMKYVHEFRLNDVELGVVLTSVAFMHPNTAKKLSFDNLQLATILPRSPEKKVMQNADVNQKKGNHLSSMQENSAVTTTSNAKSRQTILRIVYSDLVAKGHVMLPQSVRLYIGADLHSWVYVKKYCTNPRKDLLSMTISPCRLKGLEKNKDVINTGNDILESHANLKHKELPRDVDAVNKDMSDWLPNEKSFSSLSDENLHKDDKNVYKYLTAMGSKLLLKSWLVGQLGAIAFQNDQAKAQSVVLAHESLLHFQITDHRLGNITKEGLLSGVTLGRRNQNGESIVELLYLLRINFQESSKVDLCDSYEIVMNTITKNIDDLHDTEPSIGTLELGDPVIMDSISESRSPRKFDPTLSSVSWLETAISDIVDRLTVLLSPTSAKLLSSFEVPSPGHVLLYGPSGSGKTTLVRAVAEHFEEHEEILAHIVYINCLELASQKSQKIREAISVYIGEALDHSPSIIIFDNLDNIISVSSDTEESLPSSSTTTLVKYFTDLMDEFGERSRFSCGYGPIAFVASLQSLRNLPESMTSSGRFDYHVQLPAPAVSERGAILKHEIQKLNFQCPEDIISDIATKCDGYHAHDLEILVLRTVNLAIGRILGSNVVDDHTKHVLVYEDFSQEMQDFVPENMRDLTKASSGGGHSGWDDVGGLKDIRNAIQEMLELPSQFPSIFAQSPLRLRSNVLLYGPPGCGKTHIVGAAAAACSLRFISVKGPELLNKYIGESEKAVRDLFSKATAAAPCLLFFDEFDSIAPKRGHDNTGVTDRVVNQLLTELDGVESLTGVFVFAATSRPDLLDAALLRPGRLDRLLFCDFPSWHERVDILKALSRKVSLASDVNLEAIASMTDGFTGADLQAILSDALVEFVHERYDGGNSEKSGEVPVISDQLLRAVASKARPSVSEAEKRRLFGIYSQFLDSRKSVSAQSRDAKGKKATLA